MVLNRMLRPYFRRIAFFSTTRYDATGGADLCVDMDQLGRSGDIMSRAFFDECAFVSGFRNPQWIGVRNAHTSADNCEYATLLRCIFLGGAKPAGSLTRVYGLQRDKEGSTADGFAIGRGENVVRAKARGTFTQLDAKWHERIRVAGAGRATNALPVLDTHILKVIDDRHAVVAHPATNSVTDAYALVGESFGIGYENGPHQNAKRILFDDCEAYGCAAGVRLLGGSAHIRDFNFSDNEVDIHVDCAQSEGSSEVGSNSEGSRSHLWHFGQEPYTVASGSRLAMNKIAPGGPYIALGVDPAAPLGGGYVELEGNHIEGDIPPLSHVFDLRGGVRHVESRGNKYGYSWTREQMGWTRAQMAQGAKVHTLGDDMSGGPAQTDTEEWIVGGEGQATRMRHSGRAKWIFGMSFDPTHLDELQPGEYTVSQYVRKADGSRAIRIIGRDWDGAPQVCDVPVRPARHREE